MSKFYLGIDIGTNSVGMACTDENYRLLRGKGKDLWAVRLFDEANSAANRRTSRTKRRRLQRRKHRIDLLQELFSTYLSDNTFFIRLNNSAFYKEDKSVALKNTKFSLFNDIDYTDKDYYKEFPTIYHLRNALIKKDKKYDLRLYYLAIHHIIKYRGHFLFEGKAMQEINDISSLFKNLNDAITNVFDDTFIHFDETKANEFKNILLTKKGLDKEKTTLELFNVDTNNKQEKELIKFLVGNKASPKILFSEKYQEENFSIKDKSEEDFNNLQSIYGEDFILFQAIRAIINYITFEKVKNGKTYISEAMIELYNKHATNLKELKNFIKSNFDRKIYIKFFKSVKESANYTNYIGYSSSNKKYKVKICKYDDFLNSVKKLLNEKKENPIANRIIEECDNKTFLPKILHADNGLFPYQVNLLELEKILENMKNDYPTTESIVLKIKDLFLFKIPYYVGPLVNYGENSWIVKLKDEKITPWNFKEVVDETRCNEEFMRRMTNKCTYLHGKDCLPKCSIYYQKFNVLNQINKLKIDEIPISVTLKQDIFNNLFMKYEKVSIKKIKDFLIQKGYITQSEAKNISITGVDEEINCSLSSYIKLKKILGDFVDNNIDICENIIFWHTLNTNKNIVEKLIIDNYGKIKEIKEKLKDLKNISSFKNFGKLSKEFLELETTDPITGEICSILSELYNTNNNLNELLFDDKYKFNDLISIINSDNSSEISDIDDLYVSPMIKRGIRQTLKMTDEYIDTIGKCPDKIFIEVTRSNEQKARTTSRKQQLTELYKNPELKKDVDNINDLLTELNHKENLDLRQERLYLYFRQLGRCLYSGKKIDLENLSSDIYDVDHILPRSYVKDDSLSNKALVLREYNAKKSDTYPLPTDFSTQQHLWKILYKKNLLSEKTYKLLTRIEPLNEDDYKDFENRQKVITDQTIKIVIEILKKKYPNTKIVYSKAINSADFKKKYNLIKCRETNDLHHARDAYINIVVGNVYDCEFNGKFFYRNKKGEQHAKSLKTLFNYNIEGVWNTTDGINNSISIVKNIYKKTSMNITRFSYIEKGKFYDDNPSPKTDKGIRAARKLNSPLSDFSKYGGYKSMKTAYFSIVESFDKKGNKKKTIEAIPILVSYMKKSNPNAIIEYLNNLNLIKPKIIIPIIKKMSLLKIDGTFAYITGAKRNEIELNNANQWFTDSNIDEYVKSLYQLDKDYKLKIISDNNQESFLMKTNRHKEIKLQINKQNNLILYNSIIYKLDNKIYRGLQKLQKFKDTLKGRIQDFENLTILKQVEVLLEIIKVMRCTAEKANLSLLHESTEAGRILINKDITKNSVLIINQSPCGLTIKELKI